MKATEVTKLMNEVSAKEVITEADLKSGDNVMYKQGTEFAGMMGFVVQTRPGKVDIKLGKSIRVDVPVGDIVIVSGSSNVG